MTTEWIFILPSSVSFSRFERDFGAKTEESDGEIQQSDYFQRPPMSTVQNGVYPSISGTVHGPNDSTQSRSGVAALSNCSTR